jgi:hypothetical protein
MIDEIENLRLDGNESARPPQLAAIRVENEFCEMKRQDRFRKPFGVGMAAATPIIKDISRENQGALKAKRRIFAHLPGMKRRTLANPRR